jgi:hypothetical protein
MDFSIDPGRGEVKVLMKHSWIHSFCVAKQRKMGVLFNARRNNNPCIEADLEYIMLINSKITFCLK